MSDFVTMIDRISDELQRPDLTAQIRTSIKTAIDHYQTERFDWLEKRATAVTVANQALYSTPTDLRLIDVLKVTVNGYDYPLLERNWRWMEEVDVSPTVYTGAPTDWAYFDEQLRLYPVPDNAYTLTMSYIQKLDDVSADSDTNTFFTTGEQLIRCRAKWDMLTHVIRGEAQRAEAAMMKSAEMEALTRLRTDQARKIGGGISAYRF